jgi:3-oxoacyl-[acyl-carrier protein] reductase
MTLEFQDQVVAVSGAAIGFGRAIARSFAEAGARVYATDIQAPALTETAAGTRIKTQIADLLDRQACASWIRGIERDAGKAIDILVNNAGGMLGQRHKPVEEVSDADWDAIFALNVDAAFATVRAAAPAMKKAKQGRIVNISSGAAFRPSRTRIQAYASAKHAVLGLTRQLAVELGPFGITVNTVAPGLVLTEVEKQKDWDALSAERQKNLLSGIALGRLGEAQDIADATLFFASSRAKFITGQMLPVNGGSF